VDAIKNAIASGTFSVNPDKIADSLIASTQELLNQ
jgi:negative regulator of flagellin synthesis FlgM